MKTSAWHYYPAIAGYAKLLEGRLLYRPKSFRLDYLLAACVLDWDEINKPDDLTFWQRIEADLKRRAY